jgi:ribonuclease HII
MPWVVGIDEAGYGPNLGPLVQAAVAVRLPEGDPVGWETLRPVARRVGEKADWRLLIDDSKKVYPRGGFAALERSVLALVPPLEETVGALLPHLTLPWVRAELDAEPWFDPSEAVPVTTDLESVWVHRRTVADNWNGLPAAFGPFVAAVVPPARFNRICDESGSKAAVLARGLIDLLRAAILSVPGGDSDYPDEPVAVVCDKQGGRNYYAALVQEAAPEGWVVVEKEVADESRYRVEGLGRPVAVTFRPRAEGNSLPVAAASMLCKYLREVCMRQFNRYWTMQVPGVRPTAGYPGDAKRFYGEIRETMAKLGLTPNQVWRNR